MAKYDVIQWAMFGLVAAVPVTILLVLAGAAFGELTTTLFSELGIMIIATAIVGAQVGANVGLVFLVAAVLQWTIGGLLYDIIDMKVKFLPNHGSVALTIAGVFGYYALSIARSLLQAKAFTPSLLELVLVFFATWIMVVVAEKSYSKLLKWKLPA
jgi:hypothetical protein